MKASRRKLAGKIT